jgi:hypothetical protein
MQRWSQQQESARNGNLGRMPLVYPPFTALPPLDEPGPLYGQFPPPSRAFFNGLAPTAMTLRLRGGAHRARLSWHPEGHKPIIRRLRGRHVTGMWTSCYGDVLFRKFNMRWKQFRFLSCKRMPLSYNESPLSYLRAAIRRGQRPLAQSRLEDSTQSRRVKQREVPPMAYGNDARLALTTQTLLAAGRLASPIGAVTPLGLRRGSCAETFCCVGLVTTAVPLTFISLIDRAEPECVGTVPWLTDPTIVISVARLRNIHHTSLMLKRGSRCVSHAPVMPQSLPSALHPSGKASVVPVQPRARRSSDGIRARGVHCR